jgi:hypothetical protein
MSESPVFRELDHFLPFLPFRVEALAGAVFQRATAHVQMVVLDQQIPVGWCDIDAAIL